MADTIQDARRRDFFIVQNEIIERFGPAIGAYGVAVYAALCRYAGAKGECYPAHDTIAAALNVSVSTVKRAIGLLAATDPPLIRVTARGDDGLQTSNVYTLLSLTPPTTPTVTQVQKPVVGLWDSVIGPVQDAPDHRAAVGALMRGWSVAFGPDATITPAQAEALIKAAGGQAVAVAKAALSAASAVAPPIRSPYGLVLQSLTRQRGPAATQRKESGTVGYGTVQKARKVTGETLPF